MSHQTRAATGHVIMCPLIAATGVTNARQSSVSHCAPSKNLATSETRRCRVHAGLEVKRWTITMKAEILRLNACATGDDKRLLPAGRASPRLAISLADDPIRRSRHAVNYR